jgi:Icc-related predicted phosphoesterase
MFIMKYLIVPDLHGSMPEIYERFKGFDSIIAPGDFCESDKIRNEWFSILKMTNDPNYHANWYDRLGKRKAKELVNKSLESGRKVLKYLDSFNVPVYVIPGNNDFMPDLGNDWEFLHENHYKEMIEGLDNIVDVNLKIVNTGEHQIIGYGDHSRPEMPVYKNHLSDEQLKKKETEYKRTLKIISSLFEKATKPVIFDSHNVPYKTKLDKIVNEKSPNNGMHFGSLITREVIENYQPPICIGGHMHEHFGKAKIGKTVCINSGYGSKAGVFLNLEGRKIKRLSFHGKQM